MTGGAPEAVAAAVRIQLSPAPVPPRLAQALPRKDALRKAVERGDVVEVAELLESGTDPDLRYVDGDPLLLRAIKRNHGNVALALMSAGADVSMTDALGWTPLMMAVLGGQDDLAEILLEQGADPERAAEDGTTARELAALREQTALLALMDAPAGPPDPVPGPVADTLEDEDTPETEDPPPALAVEPLPERAGRPEAAPASEGPAAEADAPEREPTGEEVLEVQRRLADIGYDPGPLDGAIGPRTRRAVRAFQADRGADEDGRITASLLAELRASVPAAGAPEQVVPAPAEPDPAEAAWAALGDSEDPAKIDAYLRAHPESPHADAARKRLQQANAGAWSPPEPGERRAGPRQRPAPAVVAWAPSRPEFAALERYLFERRELFHAHLNAYNKRHEVKPNSNRSTFKVRDLYEVEVIDRDGDTYRVSVLMGVGNWHGQSQNSDLNVVRLIVLLRPSGGGFKIVGHSEDLAELSPEADPG